MKKLTTFFTVLLTLSLVFAFAGDVRQAYMEKSPGKFDPAAYMESMQLKFNWLVSQGVPLSEKSIIPIRVTQAEIDSVNNFKCESCKNSARLYKMRIGLVKPVSFEITRASSKATADGGMVWTAAAESKTATALRVHFTDFNLPANAALYIYNMDGEVFGPYTGRGPGNEGDFWSHTVTGPIAYIQLHHHGPASPADLKASNFKIAGVGHIGEKFLLPFYQQQKSVEGINHTLTHCNDNEDCVEDASCYSGGAINDAKYSAAHMLWVSGAWIYYCSGGLIADNDTGSQIPYFLTANHCMSKGRDAKNLECYFQYWTASCHSACYDPVGAVPRTLGADILDSGRNGDHTLMQLWENPPSGSVFLGWTNQPLAFADGTELFRISHPSGMPQAYSKHVVDSQYVECGGLAIGEFIYSQDVIGATEGGSSGSPVMNMNGQIVGQLYGGCGYNINEVCDAVENRTVDGAFAYYFDDVKQWLDAGGGPVGDKMHVDSIVLSTKVKGPKTDAIAKVTIVDENNNPVEGATVTAIFTGDANGTKSATTGANGEATLKINVQGSVSTFTVCVDNVTHATYTYDSAANVETCDTY
jgi:hypothetical protein